MPMYRLGILFLLLPVLSVLQACSNLGGAAFDGVKAYYSSAFSKGYASQPLDPRYVYLEVVSPTASALMVLATVDQPKGGGMPVETWVSASREVLRTQGGLVVGSEGVPKVLQQADVQRNAKGEPVSWVLNSPSGGVYQLKQQLSPLLAETLNLKSTALMKRAAKQAGFSLQAWQGTNTVAGHAAEFNNNLQVLGTVNGQPGWVYGQHCPTPNYCIEYLRRTAAQNL
ncbi:MAG: hypothetical protein KJ798_07390 [Gammaproteobacteria bacterium]|nr:hypothetical protein [Gammaproteobacteria bacterium]MBU0848599.1 hypothetical protein [Gammaproteobacteria bacterium]MBU1267264.1 hypothetical protein [Gammaproteobacteria bacterium]MBU1530289.1 hypothetical protein [Gammaproteobacteria bacterium]MBU1780192.1 hypothetical protein [Gammaproteobacteria bacterium]